MSSLEMSIQNLRVMVEEHTELSREKKSRQVLLTEHSWAMGEETNCLSDTGKVIFAISMAISYFYRK